MKKTPATTTKRLSSPRQVRALQELLKGPRSVRQLFDSTGSNGVPQLIASLKAKGLDIDTIDQIGFDRDGRKTYFGIYYLEEDPPYLAESLVNSYALETTTSG